jgi:uncharacterized Zn-binding protein involved in type VI secretion
MATPQEMKAYYDGYPTPPTEPDPKAPQEGEAPSPEYLAALNDPAYQQARADYNAALAQFEADKEAYEEEHGPPPEPDEVPAAGGGAGAGGAGAAGGAGGAGSGGAAAGAGAPAARIGDMTAHGGAITVGAPTVLIGNMPAARVADMHACPMVTGIVPHVGGPILPPGSTTVLIGMMPAARVGDQATCVGPPDVIAMGEFTVLVG